MIRREQKEKRKKKKKKKNIQLQDWKMGRAERNKKRNKGRLTSVVTARLCSRSSLFPTSAITMLGLA